MSAVYAALGGLVAFMAWTGAVLAVGYKLALGRITVLEDELADSRRDHAREAEEARKQIEASESLLDWYRDRYGTVLERGRVRYSAAAEDASAPDPSA